MDYTWLKYYWIRSVYRKLYTKITHKILEPKHFVDQALMERQRVQDYIMEKLDAKEPFMAARYGATELRVLIETAAVDGKIKKHLTLDTRNTICRWSGFFPNDEKEIMKFGHLMMESSQSLDLLGIWYNIMEDYAVHKYASGAKLCILGALGPLQREGTGIRNWTAALKGKKVLVIHPFQKTIYKQYEKRELLFDNPEYLPKFDLRVVKAVQTIAGEKDDRFVSWFEALDYMYEEAMKEDFDVALLGCGAYGFPLASMIKKAGKQAIHIGGGLQILFGIKGKRWENMEGISCRFNDAWTYPLEEEIPVNFKHVEDGCYWK